MNVTPMQFPTLQFASSPTMSQMLSKAGTAMQPLAKAAGSAFNAPTPGDAVPDAQGPTSIGGSAGPMPLAPPGQQTPPSLGGMLNNLMPQQLQAILQRIAPQQPQPQMPGASLFQQAGGGGGN